MKKLSWDKFVEKASEVHKNFYKYVKQDFENSKSKIKILCPIHGEFTQEITSHLQGHGCKKCHLERSKANQMMTKDEFMKRAIEIHGNAYSYDLFEYKGANKKGKIVCPIHGEFWQSPSKHINSKQGCPKCNCKVQTTKSFIEEASKIHNNIYDYGLVKYINANTKVKIICNKHGVFEQTPHNHLSGQGCPICKESRLERLLSNALINAKIKYLRGVTKSYFDWIGKQHLDFYLPDYNIAIECQGKQHFKKNCFFENLDIIKKRDYIKKIKCEKNNVDLIYYSDVKYDKNIFTKIDDIINYVRNSKNI